MMVFAIHAGIVGSLFSRIAEIQLSLNLQEAQLGIALVGVPLGVFVGSPFVSRLVERMGTRKTLLTALPVFAFSRISAPVPVSPSNSACPRTCSAAIAITAVVPVTAWGGTAGKGSPFAFEAR